MDNLEDFEPWRLRLREAFLSRDKLAITQFSIEIGKDKDYISRLINKPKAQPNPDLMIEICKKLGVDVGYILSGNENLNESKRRAIQRILEMDELEAERFKVVIDDEA